VMLVQKCLQAQIEEKRKKNFQETQIDRVYVESNERLWEKRLAELEERESRRRKLMEEVYAVRDAQVKEKGDRIRKLKSEYTRQGEQLAREHILSWNLGINIWLINSLNAESIMRISRHKSRLGKTNAKRNCKRTRSTLKKNPSGDRNSTM
jgi:hypothetical protein